MDWAVEGRSWLSLIFNILLVILVVVSSNLVEGGESAKLEVITREGERSSPHSEQSVHYSTFLQNFATQSIVVHSIHLYPPLWQHQCNPLPNSDLWIPRIPAMPLIPPDRWSEPLIIVPVIVKRIMKIWTWKRIVESLPLVEVQILSLVSDQIVQVTLVTSWPVDQLRRGHFRSIYWQSSSGGKWQRKIGVHKTEREMKTVKPQTFSHSVMCIALCRVCCWYENS